MYTLKQIKAAYKPLQTAAKRYVNRYFNVADEMAIVSAQSDLREKALDYLIDVMPVVIAAEKYAKKPSEKRLQALRDAIKELED